MERVLSRLTPDNLEPRPPRIIEGSGVLIGILNPVDTLPIEDESVCLGALFGAETDWWRPGAEAPEGSYALFRGDGATLELVSDIVGSRTIWYAQTDELFIAATSQRAIVCFLQGFEPNEAAYPWMLSSGTLGPGLSWDRRIRCLGPDARLRLDRRSWEVRVEQIPVEFHPEARSREEHERRLREALEATFARLDPDSAHWVLPLSGGYDSRAILLFLKDRSKLKAVTWGLKSALGDRESDAWVARELARHFGLSHEYYETDLSGESVERVFERFLIAGEGRVDHISGYMDGFAIWRRLHDSGCQGVLRGDEAFGWRPASTPSGVIHGVGMARLSDYRNLLRDGVAGFYEQPVPATLQRREQESLSEWRDRLYQTFRTPAILAALNDLKCAYVEVVNPFQARRVVLLARGLPDTHRTDKRLFKDIVRRRSPPIAFAGSRAIEGHDSILKNPDLLALISRELSGDVARGLFPAMLLAYLEDRIGRPARAPAAARSPLRRVKSEVKRLLPAGIAALVTSIRGRLRPDSIGVDLEANRLAFRAYIISRMHALLGRDAVVLRRP
ncbi:MAG: hypothetical protein IT489_00650 [Gammaproteobacteria bacterium]|nr:hypothetical protein [Gammaproteobacteria bacterium]